MKTFTHFLAVCAFLISCTSQKTVSKTEPLPQSPKAMREFRAAWVATVANINWPSKPGLTTEEQKKEAVGLLNFLQAHNFNAVIFQVRPQCDALYKVTWSHGLII